MTLDTRLAAAVAPYTPASQKMFGGVCYLVNGNMAVCVSKRGILARVGPAAAPALSKHKGVRPMEMRGRVMPGYLWLSEEAVTTERDLDAWVKRCFEFASTLPPKAGKPKKTAKPKKTKRA